MENERSREAMIKKTADHRSAVSVCCNYKVSISNIILFCQAEWFNLYFLPANKVYKAIPKIAEQGVPRRLRVMNGKPYNARR